MVARKKKEDWTPHIIELPAEQTKDLESQVVHLEGSLPPVVGLDGARARDIKYTVLLDKYVEQFPKDHDFYYCMKKSFFWVVLVTFVVLIFGSVALLIVAATRPNMELENVIIYAVSAMGSIISSIIVIPQIIAKHLFPEKRENEILDLIKTLISDDCEIRKANEERYLNNLRNSNRNDTNN